MKQCETKYKCHQIVIKCLGWIVLSCYISFPHWPLSILETSPKAQLVLKLRECLSLQGMDNNTSDFIWRNPENKQNRSQQIRIAPVLTTSHDLIEKSFEVPGHGTSFLARDCIAVSKCERSVPPGHNSLVSRTKNICNVAMPKVNNQFELRSKYVHSLRGSSTWCDKLLQFLRHKPKSLCRHCKHL